ncbi:MAG: ATP synthase F1 subunit delta [Solirubrobacteraceae bacterium]|jgi:ATP synthase F1 delta subunit
MQEIANVYARSLFEVARDHGRLDIVGEQLGAFSDELERNRDLQVFFYSPYFSPEETTAGLTKALSGADPLVSNFLTLLIEKRRMPVLTLIRRRFEALCDQENNVLPVHVTSAIALGAETVKDVGRRIGEQTGQHVELTSEVDPDILGGIVLRVGNSILDASIRNRLEQLRKEVARG